MDAKIMEAEKRQLLLEDGTLYFYSIRPVEVTNVLGVAVAVLDEYHITNSSGEVYKLHKTKEGNWYDGLEEKNESESRKLLSLKFAIERQSLF